MQLEKILEEIDNLRGLVGGEDNYINMYVKKTWDDCLSRAGLPHCLASSSRAVPPGARDRKAGLETGHAEKI